MDRLCQICDLLADVQVWIRIHITDAKTAAHVQDWRKIAVLPVDVGDIFHHNNSGALKHILCKDL